jgi:hypothetical protein
MGLLCLTISAGTAFAADDEDDAPAKPDVPNIYLDLRTIYATIHPPARSGSASATHHCLQHSKRWRRAGAMRCRTDCRPRSRSPSISR